MPASRRQGHGLNWVNPYRLQPRMTAAQRMQRASQMVRATAARNQAVRAQNMAVRARNRRGAGKGNKSYQYKRSKIANYGVRTNLIVPQRLERWQRVKIETPNEDPDDVTAVAPGSVVLQKGDPAGAGNCVVPVNIYSLTTVTNVSNANAGWSLEFTPQGREVFVPIQSQLDTGVLGPTADWRVEDSRRMEAPSRWSSIQHLWYDIRIKLYGARRQTVTYDIEVIKFNEDYLDPIAVIPSAGVELQQRTAFWQSLVRNLTTNTILPGNSDYVRHYKVLRRRRVVIQANDNDDLDRQADHVDLRWYVKDTRTRSYMEQRQTYGNDLFTDQVTWITRADTSGEVTNDPRPRSRLFVLIKATDMTKPTATDDQDDNPSYDICIRRLSRFYP